MKILVISDIHGQCMKVFNYLQKNSADLIILTGDITQFGPEKLGEDILNEICSFDIPLLAIPGNCDQNYIYREIENSNAINIHNKTIVIKNMGICGFGGSNITPFGTPLEFVETQIYEHLQKLMKEIENEEIRILVTHAPPYNTKADTLPSGDHAGSESVRKIIEEFQPTLSLCGHIHESRAVDKIGKTIIVNPGHSFGGYGSIVNINEKEEGKMDISVDLINI
ncbi:metallophosphoesterase family protein [Methanobacterium sp. ACI-7]|uniref:metallophosphoesterase family protein n=1 Tax=unclassified Methanobacterium TaxID=2627676 RepID=UPI0039C02932